MKMKMKFDLDVQERGTCKICIVFIIIKCVAQLDASIFTEIKSNFFFPGMINMFNGLSLGQLL